ncbi:MAG: hypothetical protein KIT84_12670 [Labilithrix sp.]|nr:hypothetical protein [Labilithrix sp.]MCW5811868.1 hypothetical protein [Labilithrix sp.]
MPSYRSWFAALALAALAAVGQGCAEERAPINRVQLGAMPKKFFVGDKLDDSSDDPEFYFRTTIADVSAGAGSDSLFTSSDAQPTVRIRWEITEHKIIGRLAYELITNTDQKGTNGAPRGDEPRSGGAGGKAPARPTTDGQIVAAFAIVKHFDVRRTYNESTGEENNVIDEIQSDRPWNQREYIRIDFSQNLVTDAYDLDAASQLGLYGGVKWDATAYELTDPNSPDAPVIDLSGGYFDVTNKNFAAPQMIHDPEWGDFPACLLTGDYPRISCNPSEVKMRLAFKRVTDTDYEPVDFDGNKMDMFGYFTNDRFGYDRHYGVVDDRWHRFASRWNLYTKSHADPAVACATPETTPEGKSPHRDEDKDGTEDECASVGRGSRCDEFSQACTIPLRDRAVRTIAWHVNREFPEDLFEGSRKVVKEWSDALRVAVLAGRLAECRRTNEDGCEDTLGWPSRWSDDFVPPVGDAHEDEVPEVFVLCHNPVDPAKGDDPACGEKDTSPRLGDLRYNLYTFITAAQAQAPWGIMVDAEDPLTGEKIAGSVNQYGVTLDKAAGQLADLVDLLNGTTPATKFIEGRDVSAWVQMQTAKERAQHGELTSADLYGRMTAFDPKVLTPFTTGRAAKSKAPAKVRHNERMKALAASGKLGMGNGAISQRMTKLRGGDVEARMVTPEVAQLSGLDPKAAVTKATIDRATPFARTAPLFRRALEARANVGRARRHACRREGPEADHLVGLARKAQKLFGKPDPKDAAAVAENKAKVQQWARVSFANGVWAHEFGHSVGLRHNFAGTFDSLNYDVEYWQLRTKNGTVTRECPSGTTDGSDCIGPRYSDPLTEEEIDKGIGQYATSSVMDYPGDQQLDMHLLGSYDRAAARFGYSGVVDVFAAKGMSVKGSGAGQVKAYEATDFIDGPGLFGAISFSQPSGDPKYMHYSRYASEFGLVNDCKADPDSPLGTKCRGAEMDVVDYRDLEDFASIPEYAAFATVKAAVDPKGRVRRGYVFSSDEYADSGNVPSFSYDAGADPYEQVRFLESAYENRYLLDAFRRNRTQFNSWDVVARTQSHYLDPIQNIAKTFAFAMVLDVDDPTKPPPQLMADGHYGPLAAATSVAFDLFTRMITRPEPGSYCSTGAADCSGVQPPGLYDYIFVADPFPLPKETAYAFNLPIGTGRFIHNDFDYDKGYWWSDYQKQVGSFYDKTWAFYYLSEAYDSFISNSKEDFVDGRYKNVNFATIYPEQMRRLYASLLTGDVESYAPAALPGAGDAPGGPIANLVYPEWHLASGLGNRPEAKPKIVDPAFGWNEQLYAMVWGTMLLPTTWENSFIEDARITALANEQMSWPEDETIVFVDPVTSITYRAHSTGTEKIFGVDKEKSVGARMLAWANNLVLEAYVCQVDADGYYVYNDDGTPKLKLKNGKVQPNPDFPGGVAALRRYVANIDVMRQLTSTFLRPINEALPAP